MNKIATIINLFGIDSNKIDPDSLMLTLTHKQILNEQGNKQYFNILEYYSEVGKAVYNILLKVFIYDNFSKESSAISQVFSASKYIFLDEFLNKYKINEHMICKEDTLNKKIEYQLTFQLIGFLYIEGFFLQLEKVFESVFDVKKLVIVDSYMSVINSYARGQKIQFNELAVLGPDHAREYKYELIYKDKSVVAIGKSKKEAKENCAKLFCKQYLTNDELMIYSGVRKNRNTKSKKKYYRNAKLESTLTKLSERLNLDKEDLMVCLTHASMANEYNLTDNSSMRTIGSVIENLYLLTIIFKKYKDIPFSDLIQIVNYLHTNQEVYRKFIEQNNLNRALLASKTIFNSKDSLMKAYEDTYKAILFVDFYRHKKMEVMRNFFDELYDEVLNNIDIKYIAPVSSIQKITQAFKLNNVDYTYVQNNSTYICLAKLDIPDMTINVTASGSSKRSARNSAAKKLLKWFYDQIESFLSGETDKEYDYIKLQKFLSFILNDRTVEFSKLIFENNYFGLCDAINGDKHRFIEKLSNILIKSIYHFEELTHKNIVTLLTSIPQINLVHLNYTNILIEAVIWDLYEFLLHQKETKSKIEPYSLEKNDKKLRERTRELLIKYVSDDGLLIRKIKDPDVELQMAAVKNNPKAIHYLISPAKEVLEYLLETQSQSKEIESLVLSKASNDIDFLIDMMSKKYKKYLDENNGDVLFSILSETVTFDIHIRSLFRLTEIKKFYIATGFVYSSGLDLLKNEIDQLLNQHGELKMVIGSLQNYNNGQIMKNMDRKTAIYLNEMIKKGCLIKTYDDRFYHGKMYYLESESLSIVIVGSSNLSKNAFHNNKELDVIFFYRNKPDNEYSNWFEELWLNADSISQLDISRFSATLEYDTTIEVESNLKTISRQNVEKRINAIPDEVLRKRLLLWLEYNPSNIYDDIKVAGQDYIAIEYSEREMIVLESFLHGNSYFVFYNVSINTLLELIDNKSKSEIFALSNMEKRGYHVRNLLTLELNVKSYFLH